MADKFGFEDQRTLFKGLVGKSFKNGNIETLHTAFSKALGNDADKKSAMDQAFRDKLLELLVEKPDSLESYVRFCIESCRHQMVTPTMPVVLLGDIFDALTLDKCEKMFAYVENGVAVWKEDLFFVACKNNLLRMCNDLLRRLSRSQNTVFCGRILLFLAKFFPFSERSGLNIVSEFNLENITEFGGENSGNLKDSLVLDEESEVGDSKNKLTIDYNLYCKFWALQDFFRNPNTCYNKVQWKTFVAHSSSVLSAFGSYKLEAIRLQKPKLNKIKLQGGGDVVMEEDNAEQHYFAKFLTNQKLLELQLSDSKFRRCVLVQFLILFQYLNSSVKFKLETHELRTEQNDWIKDTTSLVYKLLSETPPDGQEFANCVRHILRREENWNNWKNEGCPEFQKPKPAVQIEGPPAGEHRRKMKSKRPLGDVVREYESQGKFFMGSSDLTKLWNLCPDNLAACKNKERDFMPSLESYLAEGAEGSDPRRTMDSAWGWRALRLLARRSPHFFTHSNNPIGRLPEYLEAMVRRVARELPNMNAGNSLGNAELGGIEEDGQIHKQENNDEEISEEQMEADLMKVGDPNDVDQVPDSTIRSIDDVEYENIEKLIRRRVTMITPEQLEGVTDKLQTNWKKLAAKLGYKTDEILFFETENGTDIARAKNMLQHWFQDDEDASVENLIYIMEGLELLAACEILR